MEQKPSRNHRCARRVPLGLPVPRQAATAATRALCPACGERAAVAARRQVRRVRRLLQLSRMQVTRRSSAAGGEGERRGARARQDPGTASSPAAGRFGPYVQLGEGKDAKRASLPKDVPPSVTISRWAMKLLALPRDDRPASRDRQADHREHRALRAVPAHDGKYAKLASTAEVFETGMNAAVRQARRRGARRRAQARGVARAARRPRPASASGEGDQADGGPLRPLRHRRHDQRDPAKSADPKPVTLEEAVE